MNVTCDHQSNSHFHIFQACNPPLSTSEALASSSPVSKCKKTPSPRTRSQLTTTQVFKFEKRLIRTSLRAQTQGNAMLCRGFPLFDGLDCQGFHVTPKHEHDIGKIRVRADSECAPVPALVIWKCTSYDFCVGAEIGEIGPGGVFGGPYYGGIGFPEDNGGIGCCFNSSGGREERSEEGEESGLHGFHGGSLEF